MNKLFKPELNILIPAAGAARRFSEAYPGVPKPLIPIAGKKMIEWVLESLNIAANYIFVIQKEHDNNGLGYQLRQICPGCQIVRTEGLTSGAAATALLAKDLIDNDKPLLIANSDQYFIWNPKRFFTNCALDDSHGILTFEASHPKWSYAKLDDNGFVTEVVEKQVVSPWATVGVYYFKKGKDFVWASEEMISKNIRHNGEHYLAPCYCQLIERGDKVIPGKIDIMQGLGTPEDLEEFLKSQA